MNEGVPPEKRGVHSNYDSFIHDLVLGVWDESSEYYLPKAKTPQLSDVSTCLSASTQVEILICNP